MPGISVAMSTRKGAVRTPLSLIPGWAAQDAHQPLLDHLGELPRLLLPDVGVQAVEEAPEVGQGVARLVIFDAGQLPAPRVVGGPR